MSTNLSEELQRLQQLRDAGTLTDDEFAQAKAKLLATDSESPVSLTDQLGLKSGWLQSERNQRLLLVGLHLSQFAGYAIPLAGYVVPIVLWQCFKEEVPELNEHGPEVVNWIISSLIYMVASVLLAFIGIGFVLIPVVVVLSIAFPIIAAIKAADGKHWNYPLSIHFV